MTVKVTLADGETVEYMRFGDAYVKRADGTLDVVRTGGDPSTYAVGEWADVQGDQRRRKGNRFWR